MGSQAQSQRQRQRLRYPGNSLGSVWLFIWHHRGGCNKIPEVCKELLVGCLLPDGTRLHCPNESNFQNPRPSKSILLPPGGSSKSVVFFNAFSLHLGGCSMRLKWKQLDSHEVHEISNCALYWKQWCSFVLPYPCRGNAMAPQGQFWQFCYHRYGAQKTTYLWT